ncbi:MAG: hypothetical protein OTJ97_02865 [SAR202 cluster bacterium]|nr:hypothetical protein [SAR202 cluster bacterium]
MPEAISGGFRPGSSTDCHSLVATSVVVGAAAMDALAAVVVGTAGAAGAGSAAGLGVGRGSGSGVGAALAVGAETAGTAVTGGGIGSFPTVQAMASDTSSNTSDSRIRLILDGLRRMDLVAPR